MAEIHNLEQRILAIARQLEKEQTYMNRSELVYNLKEIACVEDSCELSRFLLEISERYPEAVGLGRFLTNDFKEAITTDYQRYAYSSNQDVQALQNLSESNRNAAFKSIGVLAQTISHVAEHGQSSNIGTQLARLITGTSGASKVKEEAESIKEHYAGVVQIYDKAQSDVRNVILDFVAFRELLLETYLTYANILVDVFGSQIKASEPELFDFNQIEFLNPQEMLQNTELAFHNLINECVESIRSISSNFQGTVKRSTEHLSAQKDRRVGLVYAVGELIGHHLDASAKTIKVKEEFSHLKTMVSRDLSQIGADLERMSFIYNTIDKIFIPRVDLFQRFGSVVLSRELDLILDQIYQDEEVAVLYSRRQEGMKAIRLNERAILDCERSISFYENKIRNSQETLSEKKTYYTQAKDALPKKPSLLIRVLTFGQASKKYAKAASQWKREYGNVVASYEDLQAEVKIGEEDLLYQTQLRDKYAEKLKASWIEMESLSQDLRDRLRVDDVRKEKLRKHTSKLVGLLRAAKEILSSKIDERYLKTTSLRPLPQRDVNKLDQSEIVSLLLQDVISLDDIKQATSEIVEGISGEEQQLMEMQELVVNRGRHLYSELMRLQKTLEEDKISQSFYREELERIQSEYQKNLALVEDKAVVLKAISEQIKWANSDDERYQGLLLLSGVKQEEISRSDWEEFLKGNKQIHI